MTRAIVGSLGTLLLSLAIVAGLTVSLAVTGIADNSRVGDGTDAVVDPSGNLVTNPSFEDDLDGWGTGTSSPDDWNPTWKRTTQEQWAGEASVRVTVTENEVTEPATSYLEFETAAAVIPGEAYLFSALSKTTDDAFTPVLRIAWFDADGNYLNLDQSEQVGLNRLPEQWTVHEYPVIAPPGAAVAYLRLQISANVAGVTGTTWWDAVRFALVNDGATPVASPAVETEGTASADATSPAGTPAADDVGTDGAGDDQAGSESLAVSVFARDLPFPYGLAALPDGSFLVGTSPPGDQGFFNSTGTLLRLVDADGDGRADDAGQTMFSGLPGQLIGVAIAGSLVFATSADDESARYRISVLRLNEDLTQPLFSLGSIDFDFAVDRLHKSYGLAVRPTPGGDAGQYDLVFNIGSATNTEVGEQVTMRGLVNGSVDAASLVMVTIDDSGSRPVFSEPTVIAIGLRNAAGLTFDPATGDLLIVDNGIDGGDAPGEASADELNRLPAEEIGGDVEDFGFPASWIDRATGEAVGSGGIGPEVPFSEALGFQAAGGAGIAVAPATFPDGLASSLFIGFHGVWDDFGAENPSNGVISFDPATGAIRPILSAGDPTIGHPDGVLTSSDAVYVVDMTGVGSLRDATTTGVIYKIAPASSSAPQATPETDAATLDTTASESANAATVRAFLSGQAADDPAVDQLVAADAQFHLESDPAPVDLPAFISATTAFRAPFSDAAYEVQRVIDAGDSVGARWSLRGTDSASGNLVEMSGISLARFADGRIAEYWQVTDRFGLRQQIAGVSANGQAFVSSEPSSTSVDPTAAKALVRRWYDEIWNSRNLAPVNLLFSGDFVDHEALAGDVQSSRCADFGGCRAGLKSLVSTTVCGFPDLAFTVEEQIVADDVVLTRWTMRGEQSGVFAGVPASGRTVEIAGMEIDRIAGDQIVERWTVSDRDGLLTQLGLKDLPTGEIDRLPIAGSVDRVFQQPSFEVGFPGWVADAGNPANWDPIWQVTTDDAVDGQASVAVTVSTGDAINAPAWLQSCPFTVEPDQAYVFSAETKTTNAVHAPLLRIIFFDADGTYIADASEALDPDQTVDQWREHQFEFTAPANAASAAVRLQINAHLATSSVWNPSFERDTNGWFPSTSNPLTWNPSWNRTTVDAWDGDAAAEVTISENTIPEPSATMLQYQLSDIDPGREYQVRAHSQSANAEFAASLEIVWRDAEGTVIGTSVEEVDAGTNEAGWIEHQLDAVAPPGADQATIRLVVRVSTAGALGSVLWDGVDVQQADHLSTPSAREIPSLVGTTLWDALSFEPISSSDGDSVRR